MNATIAVIVIARLAWIFSALLRGGAHVPLGLAQDDFYYYLRPAQNLAWHHRSVFFGNTLTNGYHPLYFLLLTAMSFFVRTLRGVFRFLWMLDTVSAAAIFLLTRQLFRRVSGRTTLASELFVNALAIFMVALCYTQICDQMEVTLALPLGFAFLVASFVAPEKLSARRCGAMGLLGALTFLARLDAGLLVFFYVAALLASPRYRAVLTWRKVASFLAACLPLPLIYFALNLHFFHTLLPISGMAKELRRGFAPSPLVPVSFSGTSEWLIDLAVLTAWLGFTLRRRLHARERVLLAAVLITPFAFYGTEMLLSDWQMWNWYFYVLRFSAVGAGVLTAAVIGRSMVPLRYPRLHWLTQSRALAALLCAAVLLVLFHARYHVDHVMTEIQQAAATLRQFGETHPGTYAMGDRAGMFAITTTNPILQTEGLMMDRAYLEHIRRGDDLRTVLAGYKVDYYVAFVADRNTDRQIVSSCLYAMEPSMPGPSAMRMRSRFCDPPVFEFAGEDGQYLVYRIHRVHPE